MASDHDIVATSRSLLLFDLFYPATAEVTYDVSYYLMKYGCNRAKAQISVATCVYEAFCIVSPWQM